MILIPVKDLSNAKQRLSPVMEQSERTRLAHAMLLDVLDAVHSCGRDTVSLVTSDPFAMEAAKQYAFDVISDKLNLSESNAIAMATEVCHSRGIESTLVIPGDIPLIEASEIQVIYDCAPKRGSVLVPSLDKRGSNAVLRNPAALFPLRFGSDSFRPHLHAAIATNATCVVLSLPGIGLDIDTPEDLWRLAAEEGNKRSQLLARSLTRTKAGSFESVNSDLVRAAK